MFNQQSTDDLLEQFSVIFDDHLAICEETSCKVSTLPHWYRLHVFNIMTTCSHIEYPENKRPKKLLSKLFTKRSIGDDAKIRFNHNSSLSLAIRRFNVDCSVLVMSIL